MTGVRLIVSSSFSVMQSRNAANLEPEEQKLVLERLKLAREMIGSIDALDYFRQWRILSERLGELDDPGFQLESEISLISD